MRVRVDSRPGGYRLRLRGRWPPEAFPQPGARRDGDRLLAWYGPQSAPALSLPPIPLDRP